MRLPIALFVAGSLCLQTQGELPARWQLLALLALLPLAWLWQRRGARGGAFILALASFAAGFALAGLRADYRLSDLLPAADEGVDIEVIGVINGMVQAFPGGERFPFRVEAVLTPGRHAPEQLLLNRYHNRPGAPESAPPLRAAERWQMTLRLKRPHGNANPHAFDYEAWLLERNVRATGYVRDRPVPRRLAARVNRPALLLDRAREEIRQRFRHALPAEQHPYGGIIAALAIGDQQAIDDALWRVFARTGTTHLMSISGLHVTMLAGLAAAFTAFAWRRLACCWQRLATPRAAILAGLTAAILYVFLAGFSVPAQRTLYMLGVAALALLSGRRTAPSRTLALAALLVTLLDPWAPLAPGFWLSFGAVGALFYALGERLEAAGARRKILATWGKTQWVATLASLPLLLFFFQQFSLVSPLANAVAIPLVSLLITPLALLAVIVPLPLILQINHELLAWLMLFLTWLADLPMLELAAPPALSLFLALLGVIWLLLPRAVPRRWLGVALLLPALVPAKARPPLGEAWVEVLDVGQGLAVSVRTATKNLLYDTGPLYGAHSNAGERVVLPYLRAIGVDRLDALLVTHGDADHAGGAASIIAALPVQRLLSSVDSLPGAACLAGQSWRWDDVAFEILYPASANAAGKRPNNRSCVLKVSTAQASILLTSDIEARDEASLLTSHAARLRADVLLVPHHGSMTSSTAPFIAAVAPQQVIYPVGYRNRFAHPRPEVSARYAGSTAWRSDRDGAILVRLGREASVSAQRQVRRRYWYGR